MKVLILSDSHGDIFSCKMAIEAKKDIDIIIHLGDGEEDLDKLKSETRGKKIYKLRGNSYFSSAYGCPLNLCLKLGALTAFMCHGHEYHVKSGISKLLTAAKNLNAKIALYGHTHIQDNRLIDEIHIINPGSVREGGYAILNIDDENIKIELKRL